MTEYESFISELYALLTKYDVELEADDHYHGYPECGSDIYITASFNTTWNPDGSIKRAYEEVNIGRHLCP